MSMLREQMMSMLTQDSIQNGFIEAIYNASNYEKVSYCLRNEFISYLIFGCFERWLDNPELDVCLKSSAKSEKTRLDAIEEFSKDRLELCLKLYNKAAQFAPHQSLEMVLALSNRSVLYLKLKKFEDCIKYINATLNLLENINSSEKGLTPKGELFEKLMNRKIDCWLKLKDFWEAQICLETLNETIIEEFRKTLEDESIQKCSILSDHDRNNTIQVDNTQDDEINQTSTLTVDVIKKNHLNKMI